MLAAKSPQEVTMKYYNIKGHFSIGSSIMCREYSLQYYFIANTHIRYRVLLQGLNTDYVSFIILSRTVFSSYMFVLSLHKIIQPPSLSLSYPKKVWRTTA